MSVSEEARKQANLRLLQRTCSRDINDIVQTSTHVVLYEYADAWEKSGVEGSLFLAQTPTAYMLVILNRNNTDNFVMDVTASMQLQHQEPFLIFKQKVLDATRIRGIWFHNADERVTMESVLQSSIQRLKDGGVPPPVQPTAPIPPTPPRAAAASAAAATPGAADPDAAATLASLLSPMALSSDSNNRSPGVAASPSSGGGVALDKKSLQLALLSLIQDDRFLDLLHSQYLRVVHARAKKGQQQQGSNT